eukprot:11703050-Alexandrium_andersonii.AAC.1
MKLAHVLQIGYVVEQPEQPASSWLFQFEPVQRVLASTKALSIAVRMSRCEGASPKPLRLKGTLAFLKVFGAVAKSPNLSKACDRLVTAGKRKAGRQCFTGEADSLTESSGHA